MPRKAKDPAEKRKAGRPPYVPSQEDREMVLLLNGHGMPQKKICGYLRIDKNTLEKHFREELDRAASATEGMLIGNLMRLAKGDGAVALNAIKFSLQCRFGWSQYSHDPAPKEPELGKKEAANIDAQDAHEKSPEWASLIN